MKIFSIGHSNHTLAAFLELLRDHGIRQLVDVRSAPFSRYCPHFNKPNLEEALGETGIEYVFLGEELGGRPQGQQYYDTEGHVLYGELSRSEQFLRGLELLEDRGHRAATAMMCSEEDPLHCHRFLLVSRVLKDRQVDVAHIRGSGTLESEEEVRTRREREGKDAGQLHLFAEGEDRTWKSTRSVSPRSQPKSSSAS